MSELKKDARARLLETISDEQKAFIYRVSILSQPFRKDQSMLLANKELGQPPSRVTYPGEAFDALVGPWIEPVAHAYFRISPLLEGTAENVLAATDQLQLCRNAAEALLETEPVTSHEITNAALLSWRAQTKEPLKSVVGFLLGNVNTDLWPRIRTDFAWLTALATTPGDILFRADVETSQILRVLQYRIAAETIDAQLSDEDQEGMAGGNPQHFRGKAERNE